MQSPLISVVIPSYNHAKFIKNALNSVISQTYQNFEIIIVDDGSTDNSLEVIQNIKDTRIKVYPFITNKGAAEANSEGIRLARGEFICVLSSDDEWVNNKLENQLEIFSKNPALGAVFSKASFINEAGEDITSLYTLKHGNVFEQPNISRIAWIRRFFFQGNCLCHPSVMIRRSCYDYIGLYDNRLRQLPDFDLWLRFILRYEFYIIDQPLIRFRILDGEMNTSASSLVNHKRTWAELSFIIDNFISKMSEDDFRKAFSGELIRPDFKGTIELEIEKAFLCLKQNSYLSKIYQLFGIRKIFAIFESQSGRQILLEKYQFNEIKLHNIMGNLYIFDVVSDLQLAGVRKLLSTLFYRVFNVTFLKNHFFRFRSKIKAWIRLK